MILAFGQFVGWAGENHDFYDPKRCWGGWGEHRFSFG